MDNAKIEIIVVGTGGTGGAYLTGLARYLYSLPREYKGYLSPCVTIIDGDKVEERNVSRQPFQPEDVGEYKSVIMAEIIKDIYRLPHIMALNKYIGSIDDIENAWYENSNSLSYELGYQDKMYILVGCVDNHHARKVMHDYFRSKYGQKKNLIYLDSANEFSVGEVVIAARSGKSVIAPTRKHYYPDIFKGELKSASELSCLEMNEVAPQHLVTNQMAANILLTQTVTVIDGLIHGWSKSFAGGIIYFDAFKSASRFVKYEGNSKKTR